MLKRGCVWGTAVAISSLLVAGCHSHSLRPRAAKPDPVKASAVRSPTSARQEAQVAQAHAHYAAGVIHELDEENAEALAEFYQAALLDPDNESLILEVSRRLLQDKQPQKAFAIVSPAAARPNASGALYARLGLIYSQLGKREEAIAADRVAIKRAPQSLVGYHNLFVTYLLADQDLLAATAKPGDKSTPAPKSEAPRQAAEALKVLDDAARQSNVEPPFLVGLSDLYIEYSLRVPAQKDKTKAKALAVLNRAVKLNPTEPGLELKLADNLDALGESKTAVQLYEAVLKKVPDLPPLRIRLHAKLADYYAHAGDAERAKEHLEAVTRDDPTNPQVYYFLGGLALDQKRPEEAAEHFRKIILLNPDAPASQQAYYDLAMCQLETKKPEAALTTLDSARKRFSQSYALEMLTGMAYGAQKKYSEAIDHYTAAEVVAKATDPKRLDHTFYFQLGAAYERKGDYEQAEKYFQKCLELAPEDAEAQNYLGYMWAEHGMKLPQARELIEKAVKAEPKNAAFLDSLGWVLYKLNQPKAALDYVLKAAELSEAPDPTLFEHLGDIYSTLNQPAKAREAWGKSLSLEPNDAVKKKLDAAK
jgi:tetratricopeptide (TPR) repeat protein